MKLRTLFKKPVNNTKIVHVGNYDLEANSNHPIEEYLRLHPFYSRNLPRIAKLIEKKYAHYSIIDVGANIGDTVALLRSAGVNQFIHCIEGESNYFSLLQSNLTQFKNVHAYKAYLGDINQVTNASILISEGTAKLSHDNSNTLQIEQLDDLATKYSFKNTKLIKIDTDGFDFKVLRGCFELLKIQKPILFFEYDETFLSQQQEDGLKMFEKLEDMGYNKIIYYDNFGKLLLSITTKDKLQLRQLYNYITDRTGAFPYYDLALFHCSDDDLASEIIEEETRFFN